MNNRILCLDDEPRVLQGLKNILSWDYEVTTVESGADALKIMQEKEDADTPFAAVISDMRMPQMDGAEFLSAVASRFPDVTRMLLTGFTDIESAMKAVNEGAIFRLLLKPCPAATLQKTVHDAIEHNRIVTAEHELLNKTLNGAIEALVETLSLASPVAFSRATTIRDYVRHMARNSEHSWLFETAALFAHMGLVAVPNDVIERFVAQRPLDEREQKMVLESSQTSARLVEHVPRLEEVAEILKGLQTGTTDGAPHIATGVSMVRIGIEMDLAILRGTSFNAALSSLSKRYDPALVDLLSGYQGEAREGDVRSVTIAQLDTSMSFAGDVLLRSGQLLVKRGQRITPALISRLENFDQSAGVAQPLLVTRAHYV